MYKFKLNWNEPSVRLLPWILAILLLGWHLIEAISFSKANQTIAVVRLTEIVDGFVKETAQQNLSMDQKQKKVNEFGHAIQKVITGIAQKRNVVIFPNEAVAAGANDLTDEVRILIKKDMAA